MSKKNKKSSVDKKAIRVLAMMLCVVFLCGFVDPIASGTFDPVGNEAPAEETIEAPVEETIEVPAEENVEEQAEAPAEEQTEAPTDETTPEEEITAGEPEQQKEETRGLYTTVDGKPGIDVFVGGAIPVNAKWVKATSVDINTLGAAKAFMDEKLPAGEDNTREYYAFDISFLTEKGEEVEPDGLITVDIDGLPVGAKINVLHIKEKTAEAEHIEEQVEEKVEEQVEEKVEETAEVDVPAEANVEPEETQPEKKPGLFAPLKSVFAPAKAAPEKTAETEAAPEYEYELIDMVYVSDKSGVVTFITDSFSTFLFTVDFEYRGYTFSIAGEDEILLSDLFTALNIEKKAAEAVNVEFSDKSLVKVERLADGSDWKLISLKSFDTNELLTISFGDGSSISIRATDASYMTMYLDVDSAIPEVQQFEYYLEYTGLDFNYDISTKQATTIPNSYGLIKKTLTVAAPSRIPISVEFYKSFYVKETPISDVHTYIQLGSDPMYEGHEATLSNIYYSEGAVCFKHMNEDSSGNITLKKEVTGSAPAGQTYQFSVVRHNGTYKWVEEIVTLSAGQTSVTIPYTHTTEYEASPQIWIAELNAPADAAASYTVNGSPASAKTRELHWRFEQDVCNGDKSKLQRYQSLKWVLLDTESSNPDIAVVCTNAFPETANLTVSKAVNGVTDNTTEFPFELTVTDGKDKPVSFAGKTLPSGVSLKSGTTNVLTFKLKNNGSVSVNNLLPKNSKVTLKETSHPNYTVSMTKSGSTKDGDTWQFSLDKNAAVTVTNTGVDVGDIEVKKNVTGAATQNAFPMELTIKDTSGKIDFTDAAFYGRATIPAGVTRTNVSKNSITFTFSLTGGSSIMIKDLVPDGASVTITETNPGGYTPSIKVGTSSQEGATRTFTVSGTGTTNVEVENVMKSASLSLSKTVTGNMGDMTKKFSFSVSYTDEDGQPQTETVLLKNGESRKISVQFGSAATITETGAEDYTTSYTVNSDAAAKGKVCTLNDIAGDTTVDFTNDKDGTPDTGINLDALPYVLILGFAVAGLAAVILRKRVRGF